MNNYKYPYIPKDYYPAVMYACSLIRKYGTFNVAVKTAANKYGVDKDEVAKHVRKRQGAGQKGTSRKYKYYVVVGYTDHWVNEYDYDILFSQYCPQEWKENRQRIKNIIKATNLENAKKQIPHGELDKDLRLRGFHLTDYRIFEYATQKEAEEATHKVNL